MSDLEIELLDEFKRVDAICKDMFSSERGVGEYIEQMKMEPSGTRYVASWDSDLRMLKRISWLRNRIAHDMTASECTEADVDYLLNFHSRLRHMEDPIAVLYRARRQSSARHASAEWGKSDEYRRSEERKDPPTYTYDYEPRRSNAARGMLYGVITVAVLALIAACCFVILRIT